MSESVAHLDTYNYTIHKQQWSEQNTLNVQWNQSNLFLYDKLYVILTIPFLQCWRMCIVVFFFCCEEIVW